MSSNEAGPSTAESSDTPTVGHQLDTSPEADSSTSNDSAFFRFSRKRRLDDLISSLDRLIWAELAVLYYVDNSFLRFLLRAASQVVYLMPRRIPVQDPAVETIITINLICIVAHLYSSQLEAGEGTRGYLHGGLLLDFIGQQGPTSKWHLFLLDTFLTLLQFISLAVVAKRMELNIIEESNTTLGQSSIQCCLEPP